jgi:PDZ domain-containing protein
LTGSEPEAPSPRSWSKWLSPSRIAAAGLLLIVVAVLALWIAPADGYQLQLVDPAHPVAPVVSIKGKRPSRGKGSIYFVDVRERPARLIERLLPWVRASGSSLVPAPPISTSLDRRLGQQEMSDSQKIAPYVALKLLKYKVSAESQGVTVLVVQKGAPAAKVIQPGDVIVAVDGKPVKTIVELRGLLQHKRPGDRVRIEFRRGGKVRKATLTTTADPDDPTRAIIGVTAIDDLEVKLPFRVKIDTGNIGGPSAGLAFALDILQELGRNVTHGHKVAATGELTLDGQVLPIGGVKQKTLGARRAGVDVFLVPAGENAQEARRYADGLRIIPVENLPQALRALATLGPKA